MWNFSGSLATSAARSSLGKANPIDASSGEIETKTSLPTRNFTWSRTSRSSLRGSEPANRRTSSAVTMPSTPPRDRLPDGAPAVTATVAPTPDERLHPARALGVAMRQTAVHAPRQDRERRALRRRGRHGRRGREGGRRVGVRRAGGPSPARAARALLPDARLVRGSRGPRAGDLPARVAPA